MKLENLEFLRLLPHWMREDNANIALSAATSEQIKIIAEAVKLATIWDKLDRLPEAFLDVLADQLHIQWYRSDAEKSVKAQIIRESDQMHMILGTRAAVERIFSIYYGRVDMREWFEYAGTHDHFKIMTEDPALVEDYDGFLRLLEGIKRQSSILDAVYVTMTHEMPIYGGVAVHDVSHETWDMVGDYVPPFEFVRYSGGYGESITYEITNLGELTISGSGEMQESDNTGDIPWWWYRSEINKIIIGDGITNICAYAFFSQSHTETLYISGSVSAIGEYAFTGMTALTDIYYAGTEEEWDEIDISEAISASVTIHYNSEVTE